MRIFNDVKSLVSEIARDLLEMGVERQTTTMQDKVKVMANDPAFTTKELRNYSFGLKVERLSQLEDLFFVPGQSEKMKNWCYQEMRDRVSAHHLNPGVAWAFRPEIWDEFMVRHKGRLAYTYNERIRTQLMFIIEALKADPMTRQAVLSIWNPTIDAERIGRDRVPCSLLYHFLGTRDSNGKLTLDIIYTMRSCDFVTHFANDVWLAVSLLQYVANEAGIEPGWFYMNISSLHYYKKDESVIDEFMRVK